MGRKNTRSSDPITGDSTPGGDAISGDSGQSTVSILNLDADTRITGDNDNAAGGIVDPASLESGSGSGGGDVGNGKRKRGRPAGSKNGGASKATSKGTDSLASLLYSVHLIGASFLKVPQLELSEDEAAKLGKAVSRVSELYDMPLMDEKTQAFVNLAMVGASIYGPRFMSYRLDAQTKARKKVQPIREAVSGFQDLTANAAGVAQ